MQKNLCQRSINIHKISSFFLHYSANVLRSKRDAGTNTQHVHKTSSNYCQFYIQEINKPKVNAFLLLSIFMKYRLLTF